MPFEENLHPVLARHFPPGRVTWASGFRQRIQYGFSGLGETGELLDLVELIDNSMENSQTPDSKNFVDESCMSTLHETLTTSNSASVYVVIAFHLVIQRHNSIQQSVPPPPGFNLDESHWQKIEKLAISNLRSNDFYNWIQVIAEIPGPREKCANAINAIMSQLPLLDIDQEEKGGPYHFEESNMDHLCKAIIKHCGSNACALLEYLLQRHGEDWYPHGHDECAKVLAEIGYWRHITFLQEQGADEFAEKLRFRLIANGSSYLESVQNSEFKEEEINREIMALQNEELRAEKMQQTPLLATLAEMKRALSSRLDSLEKKVEESSPQTVVNVMNVDVRDSVVMGNIEQSTKKDSMFDLDLDL